MTTDKITNNLFIIYQVLSEDSFHKRKFLYRRRRAILGRRLCNREFRNRLVNADLDIREVLHIFLWKSLESVDGRLDETVGSLDAVCLASLNHP